MALVRYNELVLSALKIQRLHKNCAIFFYFKEIPAPYYTLKTKKYLVLPPKKLYLNILYYFNFFLLAWFFSLFYFPYILYNRIIHIL